MPDPRMSRRARQLLLLALLGLLVLVGIYLLSVRTPLGQAWGDEAYLDRVAEGRLQKRVNRHVLEAIDVRVLALLMLAVVAIGAIRRRWFATIAIAAAFAGAMVSAELLKVALPRPVLAPGLESLTGDKEALNTFPSGHATLATSLVLGILLLVPARMRPPIAIAGAAFVAFVASGVLAAGWHRPSDAIGGIALGLLWLGAAGALVVNRRGVPTPDPRTTRLVPLGAALIVVLAIVILTVSLLRGNVAPVPGGVSTLAFPIAEIVIDIWAVAVVTLASMALRDVHLERSIRR